MRDKGIPTGLPNLPYDYHGDPPDFEWYDNVPAALIRFYADKPSEDRNPREHKYPHPPKPLVMACTWARIASYARMDGFACKAAYDRIGADIGMSGKVIEHAAAELVADGFLIDVTPPESRTKQYKLSDRLVELRENGKLKGYRVGT